MRVVSGGEGGGVEGVPRKKEHGLRHERGPHQTPHAGFEWPQFGAFSGGSALASEKSEERGKKR